MSSLGSRSLSLNFHWPSECSPGCCRRKTDSQNALGLRTPTGSLLLCLTPTVSVLVRALPLTVLLCLMLSIILVTYISEIYFICHSNWIKWFSLHKIKTFLTRWLFYCILYIVCPLTLLPLSLQMTHLWAPRHPMNRWPQSKISFHLLNFPLLWLLRWYLSPRASLKLVIPLREGETLHPTPFYCALTISIHQHLFVDFLWRTAMKC